MHVWYLPWRLGPGRFTGVKDARSPQGGYVKLLLGCFPVLPGTFPSFTGVNHTCPTYILMGKYDGSKVGRSGRLLQTGGKAGVIETLNALIYDVPAENANIVSPLRRKKPEELTELEKKVLEKQRTILRLRQDLARDASYIGTMINYSVCLFPPTNLLQALKLKADYEKKYEEINEHSDIYILQFHQESTLILKERAIKTLTKRLSKMLETMDKLQEKINKKEKKDITDGEKRKMGAALKTVDELTKKFMIEDEMSDILKIAEERVRAA